MIIELLTEHHLEFLSLKEATEAHLSLHMSKCHNVGNQMHRLNYCLLLLSLLFGKVFRPCFNMLH